MSILDNLSANMSAMAAAAAKAAAMANAQQAAARWGTPSSCNRAYNNYGYAKWNSTDGSSNHCNSSIARATYNNY
jgi:hypothetical protein